MFADSLLVFVTEIDVVFVILIFISIELNFATFCNDSVLQFENLIEYALDTMFN